MVSNEDRVVAQKITSRLREWTKGSVRRVLLYGSRSRGTAQSDSDYDFLVVEQDPVSKREEVQILRRAVGDLPYAVDVRVMGEQEFEETKMIIGGLAYPANKYGTLIYENA